jgi:S-adenosyl-L-methionine hydrolase (adenosine-forming)
MENPCALGRRSSYNLSRMKKNIAILTDFGFHDPFVGIMKGVIQNIAPQATLIDLGHNIPAGDIQRAAVTLWQARPYFPKETVFLVVVDPGVGSSRRAMIAQKDGQRFVGPDNGVFSFVLDKQDGAWELTNPELRLPTPRSTFHGRDIFAPAAAHALQGIPTSRFGKKILDLVWLPDPKVEPASPGVLHGEILHGDHFGNLLTSLGQFFFTQSGGWQLKPWRGKGKPLSIAIEKAQLRLPNGEYLSFVKTFGEIPAGQCAALVGSSGLMEIAANRQSAADILGMSGGEAVTIEYA